MRTSAIAILVSANPGQANLPPSSGNTQFLLKVGEPLSFNAGVVTSPSNQFNGTCKSTPFGSGQSAPIWIFQCGIFSAPNINGTVKFTVSNLSPQPICIQTSFGSSGMSGYVNLNPY